MQKLITNDKDLDTSTENFTNCDFIFNENAEKSDLEKFLPNSNQTNPNSQLKNLEQKLPLGINKYVLLIIIILYAVFIGTHFFNWPAWEEILVKNGAYNWLCQEGENVCKDQKAAIGKILPMTTLAMFTFTFIGGFILDIAGPKICSLTGTVLLTFGWILLTMASNNRRTYLIGFLIMGAGFDPAFFGTLNIANLFPQYGSTIIAALGAARSLANLWPFFFSVIAVKHSNFTFSVMGMIFLGINICCFFIAFFLIPYKPFIIKTIKNAEDIEQACDNMSTDINQETTNLAGVSRIVSDLSETRGNTAKNNLPISKQISKLDLFEPTLDSYNKTMHSVSAITKPSVSAKILPEPFSRKKKTMLSTIKYHFKSIYNQLLELAVFCIDLRYAPVILVCICNVLRNNFYLITTATQLGDVSTFFQVLNVLAFIPGPICGFFVDRFGPISVLIGINTTNLLSFFTLIIAEFTSHTTQASMRYLSTLFVFPGVGFLLSQVYCYIATYFEPKHMGKLAGFSSFIAGLVGLASTLMGDYSDSTMWPMNSVCIALSLLVYGFIFLLWWAVNRKPKVNV